MQVIHTETLDPVVLTPDIAHLVYNGLDAAVTLDCYNNMIPHLDAGDENRTAARRTYEFSKALQAPVLEMMLRGIKVDQSQRSKTLREMRKKLAQLEMQLDQIILEGVGVSVNWRSPAQLGRLLYGVMGLPVQKKRNANGIYAPTTDREALEKLSVNFIAEPIISHLLCLRDLGKSIGFLETGIDPDGRMRSNFSIAGTDTGRWSSSVSDFGTGCVRPTAQALTPKGWVAISYLNDGDLIAQYDQDIISFQPATFFWKEFSGELLQYSTEQINLSVTPEHRVLTSSYRGKTQTIPAKQAAELQQQKLPVAGLRKEGTKEVPAYLAMLMADCSKDGTVWRSSWKKSRKIIRAHKLLKEAEIKFHETNARNDYCRFTIYADIELPKKWGSWVLDLTFESGLALIKEAAHWDSHIRGNSFIFYSADKEQAEWFQTLAHLVGFGTTIKSQRNSDEAYGHNSVIHCVNVKPRRHAQVLQKHWGKVKYEGKVGCPTVPSSYWLVRENGFISVTGNTNLQNVTESLRSVFVADLGMKFANLDLEQADARNVGALCWDLLVESWGDAAGKYLDACEGGDLHTTVCKMSNPVLTWGDGRTDREIADQIAYRHLTYRDLTKKLGHGSNYLGTPPTMAKHAKLPVSTVKTFHENYFTAFPEIPSWHTSTILQIKNHQPLTTLYGRRRFFFGRPTDAATHRKAIAYSPQSMTGDEINTGILALWRANKVQLLIQVHDSILFQYPEELEDTIVPWALETLRSTIILKKGREFSVPTEAKTGWNWGNYDKDNPEKNPDGLKKYKGGDTRTREAQRKLSLQVLL